MLLLGNGRVVTRDSENPFLENGCVAMEDGLIARVGETDELRRAYPDAEWLDAHGGVIMPGLINAHGHLYSAFARGLSLPYDASQGFLAILDGLWWTLDRHLLLKDTSASADATFIDCIENGVTTMFDHHASYGEIDQSLFTIAQSAKRFGVRACLCYEVSDRDGKDKMRAAVRENVAFIRHAREDQSGMLAAVFGMHAPFTLSDETLAYCVEQSPDAGFHIHVAEGIEDVYQSLREHGKPPVNRLLDFGVLGDRTICGHCTHVSEAEIDILAQTGCFVAHNPESNMGNAIGCPPALRMLQKGVPVALGTDGYTNDMLESLKVAKLLHEHHLHDASVGYGETERMLFENNRRLAGRFFATPLGILRTGAAADVIALDYRPPTPMGAGNVTGHVLFGMSGRSVIHTVANGRVLMKERALQGVDKEAEFAHCRETAAELWKRLSI